MDKNLYAATHQKGNVINTLQPKPDVIAGIYDEEQREKINQLIESGLLPNHTSVAKKRLKGKLWDLEDYDGKFGKGVVMLTKSPYSYQMIHKTYFLPTTA